LWAIGHEIADIEAKALPQRRPAPLVASWAVDSEP
jgi:hypothetical protein